MDEKQRYREVTVRITATVTGDDYPLSERDMIEGMNQLQRRLESWAKFDKVEWRNVSVRAEIVGG